MLTITVPDMRMSLDYRVMQMVVDHVMNVIKTKSMIELESALECKYANWDRYDYRIFNVTLDNGERHIQFGCGIAWTYRIEEDGKTLFLDLTFIIRGNKFKRTLDLGSHIKLDDGPALLWNVPPWDDSILQR